MSHKSQLIEMLQHARCDFHVERAQTVVVRGMRFTFHINDSLKEIDGEEGEEW